MRAHAAAGTELDKWLERYASPFLGPVPSRLQEPLAALQHERLIAALPLLCLIIAANALAMAVAVLGDLPWWQQLTPPAILIAGCLFVLARSRLAPVAHTSRAAWRQLRRAPLVTVPLGLVAGLWCVNAFAETEKYYCMVAPVFIGIAALVGATCLLAVPRAAIGGMLAAVLPIVTKMALFDNTGVRAMAVMMLLVTAMQAWVVRDKFRETVRMLDLQHELDRMARTDCLTGLDNRLAFEVKLSDRLAQGAPVLVAMADLDGFKAANDTYGHHAGDAVLAEVAARLRFIASDAVSLARLGGDEFALLFDAPGEAATRQAYATLDGLRSAIALPYVVDNQVLVVATSLGAARSGADGYDPAELLRIADRRLYEDKAARRRSPQLRVIG